MLPIAGGWPGLVSGWANLCPAAHSAGWILPCLLYTSQLCPDGWLFRLGRVGLLGFWCLFFGLDCGGKVRQRDLFSGFCFGLQFAQRGRIVQHAINHIFVLFGGKFCGTQRIFPQELRHLLAAHTVAVVGGVLPILVPVSYTHLDVYKRQVLIIY